MFIKTEKKKLKVLWRILKSTKATGLLSSYVIFVLLDAFLIWVFDPAIKSYGDSLWFCYSVISTAGFGDVTVTTFIAKVLSIILTIYSVLILAIITGVVVNYYNELIKMRNKETLVAFLDKLEVLPDLSDEELVELSEQVKNFRDNLR